MATVSWFFPRTAGFPEDNLILHGLQIFTVGLTRSRLKLWSCFVKFTTNLNKKTIFHSKKLLKYKIVTILFVIQWCLAGNIYNHNTDSLNEI